MEADNVILDNILKFSRFLVDSKVNFYFNVTYQDLKFELKSSKPVEHTNRHDDRFSTKLKTNKKTPLQKARDTKRMKMFQARKREE